MSGAPETDRRPATEGVPLRPAATVMMVRDGDHPEAPLEVLMVRRNLRSDFVGGAYVFPGGALDPADGGSAAEERCTGRTDEAASAVLGLPAGGLAYWVAGLRECFEEAGLLLACRDESAEPLSLADEREAQRFAHHRQDVNDGRRQFLEVCREERLRLPLDRVHYFSHWITPEGSPRRYDTRFFVAAAPPDQTPAHDAGETIADVWVRPADALARHRAGEIELIFPTIRTLQAIGRCATKGELLAVAEAASPALAGAPPILPRVVVDGRGARILLPGDPGYDEAGGARQTSGAGGAGRATPASRASFSDVALAASRAANPEPGTTAGPIGHGLPAGPGADLPVTEAVEVAEAAEIAEATEAADSTGGAKGASAAKQQPNGEEAG